MKAAFIHANESAPVTHFGESTGIALLRGRDFTEQDGPNSPGVVIVNEEFVRRMFPHEDALGKRIAIPWHEGDNTYSEIIDVAKNVKYEKLTESPRRYLYVPFLQHYQSLMWLPSVTRQ